MIDADDTKLFDVILKGTKCFCVNKVVLWVSFVIRWFTGYQLPLRWLALLAY